MAQMTTYLGGCHCRKVRYQVQMELNEAMSCNCSICSKVGSLLSFVPVEQFKLLSGEDALGDYQFNKHRIHHFFCKTCGIRSFAAAPGRDGHEMRAINVRCLDDVDLDRVTVKQFDGKSL